MARRTEYIKVAVTAAEKATMRRRAAAHDLPMATYLRTIGLYDRGHRSQGQPRDALGRFARTDDGQLTLLADL